MFQTFYSDVDDKFEWLQSDLEGYHGDLLKLLDTDDIASIPLSKATTAFCDQTTPEQTKTIIYPAHTPSQGSIAMDTRDYVSDHKYCRSPLRSDSGMPSPPHSDSGVSSGPVSPPLSDYGMQSGADSPLSTAQSSGQNPSRSNSAGDSSPLGGGIEDLQLTDLGFDAFAEADVNLLTEYEKLVNSIGGKTDTALDMGRSTMFVLLAVLLLSRFLIIAHVSINQISVMPMSQAKTRLSGGATAKSVFNSMIDGVP